MSAGVLYLLPTPLARADTTAVDRVLPAGTLAVARRLDYFLAENAKSARAFLKAAGHPRPIAELAIVEIGHRPDPAAIDGWLQPLRAAEPIDCAIVSEAGCPGVADPGADLVARAHALGIGVVPLVGPSSPLLALMASGLNGQCFRFAGYLPQETSACAAEIRALEQRSASGETQLFIETPYRNEKLFELLLAACAPTTRLTVALDLTATDEVVVTRTIAQWRTAPRLELNKKPCIFALSAARA